MRPQNEYTIRKQLTKLKHKLKRAGLLNIQLSHTIQIVYKQSYKRFKP